MPHQKIERVEYNLPKIVDKQPNYLMMIGKMNALCVAKLRKIFSEELNSKPVIFDFEKELETIYWNGYNDGVKKTEAIHKRVDLLSK